MHLDRRSLWLGVAALPYWLAVGTGGQAKPAPSDFSEVRAILRAQCVSCHTAKDPSGGLNLESLAGIRKGGNTKNFLVPGDPDKSVLLRRIRGLDGLPKMPMGFAPLSAKQEATIADWIKAGASFEAQEKKHWAYVPPVRAAVPGPAGQNPIDGFIRAKLAQAKLKPAPEAGKEALIRRLSLDLLGLPPSVEEVDAFLADNRPDAYERLVDRYLASPHYGERQARIWLDLARYADSDGFEKDNMRTAWKYRDWVIDAFNRNQRFDQFTIDQLAGDLLPKRSLDQLVATGFHRNTMFNREGGVDKEEGMYDVRLDRVNTTSTVWMGSTMECARCHDHKYDPFSHKEYFSLFAFFNNNQYEPKGNDEVSEQKYHEPEVPAPTPEQQSYLDALDRQIQSEGDAAKKAKLQAEKKRALERVTSALVILERPTDKPLEAKFRAKGAFVGDGPMVPADVPAVFGVPLKESKPNRLALAKWLVDRKHPLTARVQVNRFWEQHFGRGIVATSEDFGTQSQPPTHPELLDWLAVEFMESGWNMKAMHRLIVTSATYKQDSKIRPELKDTDPTNDLLARGPRFRLEAEAIRDTALAAGGLLNPKVGGPSVYPPQPEGVWDNPFGATYNLSSGADRYRRGLYTVARRTSPYPSFLAFDATSRESCTVRRVRTNTPLQALVLMNDPVFLEAARGLAKRMAHAPNPLEYGFRLATSRRPSAVELSKLQTAYEKFQSRYSANPTLAAPLGGAEEAALTMTASVLLNLDEAITLP